MGVGWEIVLRRSKKCCLRSLENKKKKNQGCHTVGLWCTICQTYENTQGFADRRAR